MIFNFQLKIKSQHVIETQNISFVSYTYTTMLNIQMSLFWEQWGGPEKGLGECMFMHAKGKSHLSSLFWF